MDFLLHFLRINKIRDSGFKNGRVSYNVLLFQLTATYSLDHYIKSNTDRESFIFHMILEDKII